MSAWLKQEKIRIGITLGLGFKVAFHFLGLHSFWIPCEYSRYPDSKSSRFMHIKNGGASDLPPKKFLLCVNRHHHLVFLVRENS
jgi:hypothetical protein